jgi:hypothetical protein
MTDTRFCLQQQLAGTSCMFESFARFAVSAFMLGIDLCSDLFMFEHHAGLIQSCHCVAPLIAFGIGL